MAHSWPILFTAGNVDKVRAQTKTETRRLAASWAKRKPGDLLWVRERFAVPDRFDDVPPRKLHETTRVRYLTDEHYGWELDGEVYGRPRAAMHMPRWAARLWLSVQEVRVEPLQAITREGARAEGCSSVQSFRELWDGIHDKPKTRWRDNPEVVVLRFELVII